MTKEEISRIMRLVKEGKLSPEDAAELIDAFNASESQETAEAPVEEPVHEYAGDVPPPPPPPPGHPTDPFHKFVDMMEGIGKEASKSVNWHDIAKQIREGTHKGVEGLKVGLEQLKKSDFRFVWPGSSEVKEINLPLTLAEGKTLRIENQSGSIKVTGGHDQGSVSARISVRGFSHEDAVEKAEGYTMILEESDHQVLIRQPDISGVDADLVIQIGKASQVEVKSEAGDIRLMDTGGGCRVNTKSGDIIIHGLNGPIEVVTQNGDLQMENIQSPSITLENKTGDMQLRDITGPINARSASGDIQADKISGKTIAIESVNGDVQVDLLEPVTGAVNLRTVNGDAQLSIADGSDCRVSLSTLRGDVSCGLDLQDSARQEQRITGRLGNGNGTIDVSAVNGDVTLSLRDSG